MKIQRWGISALALVSVLYSLVVLWYVPTQPTIPLGCLLTNSKSLVGSGLEIRDVSQLRSLESKNLKILGTTPEVGDLIIAAAGRPIHSFGDWARLHRDLRNWTTDSAARISMGKDPTEDSALSNLGVFEYLDKSRIVVVWFLRPGNPQPMQACLPLVAQPTFSVSMTLLWFVLELCILIVGGMAYWNRPFDLPLRHFCVLSAVTLAAFVGGSHWWLIAGSPLLTLGFAIAGPLLPAFMLHFFLVFPFPAQRFGANRFWNLVPIYILPVTAAISLSAMTIAASFLTGDHGEGPFAQTIDRLTGHAAAEIYPRMRVIVYGVLVVAAAYFLLSFFALRRSLLVARNPFEKSQARSLLWAALVASVLIGYTMYLAGADQVGLALGKARLPMFGASLAFMFAYAIGIARYKLLLIDQIVSQGAWYYVASAGLTLIFSALIAVGAMNQELSIFGQSVPIVLVLMTAVFVLSWGRDSLQRLLDRRFFSEKYQLDKALNRMNSVVASALEPEAVSDALLNSCRDVLHVEQASLFVRRGDGHEFRMFTASGTTDLPLQISVEPAVLDVLAEELVVQRVLHSVTPTQKLIRHLHAEVVYALDIQGEIKGLVVLGAKPNNQHFSAEDLAFVGAMARISGVALYCATVQQDVTRLNHDLQQKMDKIEDQQRQLTVLQNEVATLTKLPSPSVVETEFRRDIIKGNSPAIQAVLETVKKVAGSDSSVLILGESGTGKELLARTIHDNSQRRTGPMVTVHCAALAPMLLESELFGHVKGAFTDARNDKQGRFQLAHGGTLFLDEIGEISQEVQVKLLRVLQERVIEPVGSSEKVAVDVRIVAATHRNLEQLIARGEFREDLYYRLNVISIGLPPLRERQEDLYELAIYFLRRSAAKNNKNVMHIDDEAMKCLHDYHWPGNIRELDNVIERAVVLAESSTIQVHDLPSGVQQAAAWPQPQNIGFLESATKSRSVPVGVAGSVRRDKGQRGTRQSLEQERRTLMDALAKCDGNKAEAARLMGIPRSTFFSKLKKHDIN
ncbi:sigma 54-interacting transcriptional regulator [Planctomicrobium sp. SH527]|uniref:sigma 54-interacting transcriptional regulator n=1 Tax=Planctomicrobium sp. SH527 TaxID=3448123 RepID=UPI003F5B318C